MGHICDTDCPWFVDDIKGLSGSDQIWDTGCLWLVNGIKGFGLLVSFGTKVNVNVILCVM